MAREEIFEIFGDSDRPCTAEDAAQMKYLECCIKEALRLYPAVPSITRQTCEDSELGGYKIPSGVSVVMQIYALHRNEEFFPEPEVFKPERFQTEESLGRHPFAFVPFSAGPRNCIGTSFAQNRICSQNSLYDAIDDFYVLYFNSQVFFYCAGQRFAMLEEKVLASTLLRKFQFAYDSVKHGQPNANAELVLRPKHGMPLKIAECNRLHLF